MFDPINRRSVIRGTGNQVASKDNFTMDNNIQVKALTGALSHGPFRLQINANNISGERYVAACYARGDCYYGLGRTVLGTATYRF